VIDCCVCVCVCVGRRQDLDIECVAVINDNVGVLMAGAHSDPNCRIGLILGTSSRPAQLTHRYSLYPRDGCQVLRSTCLSVCLFVCTLAYLESHIPNFTKVSVHVTCGRGSVLFGRQCNTLCTSGFVDDVMFSRNEANDAESKTTLCLLEFAKWRHRGRNLLDCRVT